MKQYNQKKLIFLFLKYTLGNNITTKNSQRHEPNSEWIKELIIKNNHQRLHVQFSSGARGFVFIKINFCLKN